MWNIFSRDPTKDFPYDINQQQIITDTSSVWTICKGRRKTGLTSAPGASGGTNEEITIFIYDIKSGNDQKLELARSFVKRVKTLRHPGLLLYIDSVETDKVIYVATENVEPLGYAMSKWEMNAKQKSLYVSWGFYQISVSNGFTIGLHHPLTLSALSACPGLPDQRLQPAAQQRQLLVGLCECLGGVETGWLRVRDSE